MSWAVLALALVAQVLVVFDISVVNTALPTIGADLQLSSGDLQWVVTAYLLMSGGGLLLGGRIADLLSRRRVLITGLAVFTTASLVSGFASTAGVLIGARAAQGLGAALMTPAALAIIMTTYAGAQRAKGLAMWGAVGGLGIAAGVLVGGVITTFAGWQMIFWVNVPIGVGAIIAALVLLGKNGPARPGLGQLDLPGALAAVTGLAALVFGIQSAASDGWTSPKTLGVLAVSGLLLVAFGFIERRVAHPLVPPHTWRIKTLVSGTGVMLGVTGLLVGAVFLSSVFFQTVLGYTALQAGLAFLPMAAVLIVGTRLGSHLLGHVPPRLVAAGGLLLAAGGAFWLSTAPVSFGSPSCRPSSSISASGDFVDWSNPISRCDGASEVFSYPLETGHRLKGFDFSRLVELPLIFQAGKLLVVINGEALFERDNFTTTPAALFRSKRYTASMNVTAR